MARVETRIGAPSKAASRQNDIGAATSTGALLAPLLLGWYDRHARVLPWRARPGAAPPDRSEEHTSELQSLMRISYAVFCLKKKNRSEKATSTSVTLAGEDITVALAGGAD